MSSSKLRLVTSPEERPMKRVQRLQDEARACRSFADDAETRAKSLGALANRRRPERSGKLA